MAIFTSVKSGNWTAADTWDVGSGYPQSADDAVVTGYTVTQDAAVECVNLTIGASGILTTANYAITISGNWDQSSTSSCCNAGTSTITQNGDGFFKCNGTVASTQYNSASIVLNGTNTLTYNNLSVGWVNGFANMTGGQSAKTTTLATNGNYIAIINLLTIGTGIVAMPGKNLFFLSTNPLSVDLANSRLNVTLMRFRANGTLILPPLANGYGGIVMLEGTTNQTVTQTGDMAIALDLSLAGVDAALGSNISWNTDGYNLTIYRHLKYGKLNSTGLKKLDATATGGRASTITVGYLGYGTANWTSNEGTLQPKFIADNSTVIFTGTGTITSGKDSPFNNVIFNGSGKTFTIADELRCNNLTYTAGTIVNPGYIRPWPYPTKLCPPIIQPLALGV